MGQIPPGLAAAADWYPQGCTSLSTHDLRCISQDDFRNDPMSMIFCALKLKYIYNLCAYTNSLTFSVSKQ